MKIASVLKGRTSVSVLSKLLFLVLTVSISGCNKDKNMVVVDDDDAEKVLFEDVAKDVQIVPLISDEPIGAISEIFCYDNEIFIKDMGGENIYHFVDGKLENKLHAVGRGRGQYISISHFTYCPGKRILLVCAIGATDIEDITNGISTTIMKYSVPEMKYLGTISMEGLCSSILPYSEEAFIAPSANLSMDTCVVKLVDIETGKTIKNVYPLTYYAYMQSDATFSYLGESNISFCIPGFKNKLVSSQDDFKPSFSFSFGSKNIPKEHLDMDLKDPEYFFKMLSFMTSEAAKDCLEGGFLPIVNDSSFSFWYHKALEDRKDHYFQYKDGNIVNYSGLYVPGMHNTIMPKIVTNQGYATVFEGTVERYFNNEDEGSDLAKKISDAMKNQVLNNPVVLLYRL